jgi:hypothetical protein
VADSPANLLKEKKAVIAMAPSPARQPEESMRAQIAPAPAEIKADKKTALASAPLRQFGAGTLRAKIAPAPAAEMADNKAATATAPPPPPPAPAVPAAMPVVLARKAEGDAAPPVATGGLTAGAAQASLSLDARSLFYVDQAVPVANAFVQPSGGGGTAPAPAFRTAPGKDAPSPTAKGDLGRVAPVAPRLGVRVSILRATGEVDLTTLLDPGETVRLKVIPNADGFLYVAAGTRTVARGRAQRFRPFETPELRIRRSGQKQLTVLLSRRPRTVAPLPLDDLARDDLVRSSAGQEPATYIVAGPRQAGAQEVVVPITLTYR